MGEESCVGSRWVRDGVGCRLRRRRTDEVKNGGGCSVVRRGGSEMKDERKRWWPGGFELKEMMGVF